MRVKLQSTSEGHVTITVTSDEFGVLQNALNEALESVAPSEVFSRLGASAEEVESILDAFRNLEK